MLYCNVIKSRMHVLRGGGRLLIFWNTLASESSRSPAHTSTTAKPTPPPTPSSIWVGGRVEGLDLLKTSDIPVIILKMFSNYVIHLFQTNYFPSPKLILQLLRCQRAEDASRPPHQPRALVVIIIAISWWAERDAPASKV